MKKVITIVITLAMLLSCSPAAFADAMDEVVAAVQATMSEPPEGVEYGVSHAGRVLFVTISQLGLGYLYEFERESPTDPDGWREDNLAYVEICKNIQTAVDRNYALLHITVFLMLVDDRDLATPLLIVSPDEVIYDAALAEAVWFYR